MKFCLAFLLTVAMALVLASGVAQAAHGSPSLLIWSAVAFVASIGYWGCRA
ncbi:MAG: hypothetical protein ACYDC1_24735 [Limisphaerales bacterium]